MFKLRAGQLLVAAIAWTASASCNEGIRPEWLWLPAEASTDATPGHYGRHRTMYADGSGDMVFWLSNADRRDDLSRQLVDHFDAEGWRRRETDYLNPGLPTSFRSGWRRGGGGIRRTDAQGRPISGEVYIWHGEWENQRGDVISYRLQAGRSTDIQGQVLGDYVRGYAVIVPRALAAAGLSPRPSN